MTLIIQLFCAIMYLMIGVAIYHDMEKEEELAEEEKAMVFGFLLGFWPLAILISICICIYFLIVDWMNGDI